MNRNQVKRSKLYTLLLLGPQGRSWKLRIPKASVYVVLGLGLIGVFGLTVLTASYARMLLKVSNYDDVRADREALRTKYHLLEKVVKQTNTQLTSLETLASQVAVTYGFGKTEPARPPEGAFTAQNSTTELTARYDESLYAFNLIERASRIPSHSPAVLSLLSNPLMPPSDIPYLWPVQGEVTAGFGERLDPFSGEGAFHAGIDIAAPEGTPVRAAGGGIVLHAGPGEPGFGNDIIIDDGAGITTQYAHLHKVFVVEGQEVKQGQVIGSVGMTGRATGPHLHYEILVHNTPVNPAKFLSG
ncbi:MAG: M23 family metallopeptidase [Terriglobia bacterium]